MNFIKVLGVVLLCIASLAVLLAIVFLTAFVLGLGIWIDVPGSPLLGKVFLLAFSYTLFSLFAGLALAYCFWPGRMAAHEAFRPKSRLTR